MIDEILATDAPRCLKMCWCAKMWGRRGYNSSKKRLGMWSCLCTFFTEGVYWQQRSKQHISRCTSGVNCLSWLMVLTVVRWTVVSEKAPCGQSQIFKVSVIASVYMFRWLAFHHGQMKGNVLVAGIAIKMIHGYDKSWHKVKTKISSLALTFHFIQGV